MLVDCLPGSAIDALMDMVLFIDLIRPYGNCPQYKDNHEYEECTDS